MSFTPRDSPRLGNVEHSKTDKANEKTEPHRCFCKGIDAKGGEPHTGPFINDDLTVIRLPKSTASLRNTPDRQRTKRDKTKAPNEEGCIPNHDQQRQYAERSSGSWSLRRQPAPKPNGNPEFQLIHRL